LRPKLLLTLSGLLLFAACASPPEPAVVEIDLDAARAAVMQADQDWYQAYSSSDNPVEVFVDGLVDDGAHLLPPDAPLSVGKEAIGQVIAMLEAMPGFSVRWSPSLAEVGGGGDLGYTIGTYQIGFDGQDGQPVEIVGKYLTVWRKQSDGTWKVAADMFNPDTGPGEAPPEGD